MSLTCAVLISGRGSNLDALIRQVHKPPQVPAQIGLVVSNRPRAGGLEHARQAGIAHHCVDHTQHATRRAFEQALGDVLREQAPDLLLLAGFMRVLSGAFISEFAAPILNIHPSLLPDLPGLDTHARALARGDLCAGASVHRVTQQVDAGPIIARVQVPVVAGDDAQSLARRVLTGEHLLYPLVVKWVAEGRLDLHRQPPQLDGSQVPELGINYTVDTNAALSPLS